MSSSDEERRAAEILGRALAGRHGQIIKAVRVIVVTTDEYRVGVAVAIPAEIWNRYLLSRSPSREISRSVTYAVIGIEDHGNFLDGLTKDLATRAALARLLLVLFPHYENEEASIRASMAAAGAPSGTVTILRHRSP